MRVAALGRTEWLYKSVFAVEAAGHEIVLIGTCPAAPEYSIKETDFEQLAQRLGCPFFCTTTLSRPDYIQALRECRADVAISVNWLTLLGQEALNQFPHGVINAHAGDLPRFRGNATSNWAILLGESRVVLSLHQMALDLDAGAILLQRACPLRDDTYIADVYRFLEDSIPAMFVEVLEGLGNGTILPKPQATDPALAIRCLPRLPRDGEIDWSQPASDLARLVRASADPFAGAYTFLGTEKLTVWRAHAEPVTYRHVGRPGQVTDLRKEAGEVAVLTGDGVLVIEQVEFEGKGRSPATAVLKSIRTRLGMDLANEIVRLKERLAYLEKKLVE